jgi:hypothetical protein
MHILHILNTLSIFLAKMHISAYFFNFPDFFCQKYRVPILSLPALRFSNRQHNTLHRYLGGNYLFFKIRNIVSQSETFNMPQSDITHNLIV